MSSISSVEMNNYLPSGINIQIDVSAVQGSIGEQALEGKVAFHLSHSNESTTADSSYLVVMDLYGNVTWVEPLYNKHGSEIEVFHGLALKMKNSSHILIGTGADNSMKGPRMLYDVKTGVRSFIGSERVKGESHDLQWSTQGDTFWSPTMNQWDAITGHELAAYTISGTETADVNHIQLLEEDTMAVISSRSTDSIVIVNMSGTVQKVLGGEYGEVALVDMNGEIYDRGATLWTGQHNAEYFGEGEYYMFDNEYNTGNNSRLLMVEWFPNTTIAQVKW